MLVLTRRDGQEIVLGKAGEVRIVVLSVRGDAVRLGITAPRDLPVHRREVYEQIQKQKE